MWFDPSLSDEIFNQGPIYIIMTLAVVRNIKHKIHKKKNVFKPYQSKYKG